MAFITIQRINVRVESFKPKTAKSMQMTNWRNYTIMSSIIRSFRVKYPGFWRLEIMLDPKGA